MINDIVATINNQITAELNQLTEAAEHLAAIDQVSLIPEQDDVTKLEEL